VATHEAINPNPPKATVVYFDPKIGHIAVGRADAVERNLDGREGTLLQGEEKMPTAVFAGDAIVEYEDDNGKPTYVYAVMRPGDVSAWFRRTGVELKTPALPESTTPSATEELSEDAPAKKKR